MSRHSIRLHGPWFVLPLRDVTAQAVAESLGQPDLGAFPRLKVPHETPQPPAAEPLGGLLMVRPFRQPTGLTPDCRISLQWQSSGGVRQLWLNGVCLLEQHSGACSETQPVALADQNRVGLVIDLAWLKRENKSPVEGVSLLIEAVGD